LYEDRTLLGDRNVCKIMKLYSSLPRSEQQSVFQPALAGTIKVVLATNIAETSVTIPDVTHVIDTGRVKESRFNSASRIKELVTVWTSQASLKQRAGRAGRTSSGVCWRLFSNEFYERLIPQTAPEMTRTPLDELILQICLLYEQRRDEHRAKTASSGDGDQNNTATFPPGVRPIQFLSKTPSPPPQSSLLEGCRHLLEVNALRIVDFGRTGEDEESRLYRLTPLGYHLSRLPMDAKVGKILIIGCILGCLDGALTVAAALSCTKSCFFSFGGPASNRSPDQDAALQARASLVENGFGGRDWMGGTVKGDLIATIAVYRAWKKQKSEKKCWEFCKSHALDHLTLKEMDQLRNQFLDLLADAGFIASNSSNVGSQSLDLDECNQASEDALLTSCCLVGGLYPNICTLMRPRKGGPKGGRLLTKEGEVCRPQSNSFQRKRVQEAAEIGKDAYAVFHSKQKIIGTAATSPASSGIQRPPEVFLTEVNFVSRFALLLFGGNLRIVKNAIIVDDWLKFKVSSDDKKGAAVIDNAILILALREALDEVVLEHVLETSCSPEKKEAMMERHKAVIQVVRKLLSEEG